MTPRLGDGVVAAALDATAAGFGPLFGLAYLDPFGIKARTFGPTVRERTAVEQVLDAAAALLDAGRVPGTAAWADASEQERVDWWIGGLGSVSTLPVAFPGMLGVLGRMLPLQDALGFLNQAVVLLAVARERGIDDRDRQVRMLAAVLCRRDLRDGGDAGTVLSWVRRPVRSTIDLVRAVNAELARRPQPAGAWRALGVLPLVGALAGYVGERAALSRAAADGQQWLGAHPVPD
ncbi:hypothetical protein QYS60_22205 [Rhodococcus sp. GXMU-t2271]|uniref:hypothetical protein n=1 Tax=Rhodococcus sp. GXMU-t2271 TaxID=3059079 RepID=UPI00352A8112